METSLFYRGSEKLGNLTYFTDGIGLTPYPCHCLLHGRDTSIQQLLYRAPLPAPRSGMYDPKICPQRSDCPGARAG